MITPDSMAGLQDAENLRKTFKQKKLSSTAFVQYNGQTQPINKIGENNTEGLFMNGQPSNLISTNSIDDLTYELMNHNNAKSISITNNLASIGENVFDQNKSTQGNVP